MNHLKQVYRVVRHSFMVSPGLLIDRSLGDLRQVIFGDLREAKSDKLYLVMTDLSVLLNEKFSLGQMCH